MVVTPRESENIRVWCAVRQVSQSCLCDWSLPELWWMLYRCDDKASDVDSSVILWKNKMQGMEEVSRVPFSHWRAFLWCCFVFFGFFLHSIYPICHHDSQFVLNWPPLLGKGYAEYENIGRIYKKHAQGCSLKAWLGCSQPGRRKPKSFLN